MSVMKGPEVLTAKCSIPFYFLHLRYMSFNQNCN